MPLNNIAGSAASGDALTYDPAALSSGDRQVSWVSESGNSKLAILRSAVASSTPHLPTQSSHGHNRANPHLYGGEDDQQDSPQVGHPQNMQSHQQLQQQYHNNIHRTGQKFFYATTPDRSSDQATVVNTGINGSANHIRASNSSNKIYHPEFTAQGILQQSNGGCFYLKKQSVDSPAQHSSTIQLQQQQHGQQQQLQQSLSSSNLSQGLQASSSPGLDGHSLYCTEVLPVATPPSQPITVEGGGSSGCGLVSINGGTSVSQSQQPLQYTIVLADPRHHQQQQQQQQQGILRNGTTSALVFSPTQVEQQLRFTNKVKGAPSTVTVAPPAVGSSLVVNKDKPGQVALLNTSQSLTVSSALVTYPLSLSGANSQNLLIKPTAENGIVTNHSSGNHLTVKGDSEPSQHNHQILNGFGQVSVAEPAHLRLVQLPEAGHGLGAVTPGYLLLTYAPAGSGNVKDAGSHRVAVADIASITQIQGLNVSSSNGFQFQPLYHTRALTLPSSSIEVGNETKGAALPQTSSLTLNNVGFSQREQENACTENQESNLSNHIRVLSANAKCCPSSISLADSLITTSCVAPSVRVLSSSRRSWAPLDRVQSESSQTAGDPQHTNLVSSSPVPTVTAQQPLKLWNGATSASDGAPEGMHSGRVGHTGSGQHPNTSNSSTSRNSNSNTNNSDSSINLHHRTNSPTDRGSENKPASALSPTLSTSGTNSPPAPPATYLQHRFPQPHATSLGMLSAGPPSIPTGIFRTGGESPSGSARGGGTGSISSSSYSPSPYSSLYGGLHGQQTAQNSPAHTHPHLPGLAPYHTFFPSSAAAAGSLHAFGPGALMIPPASSPGGGAASSGASHPYPRIESYSAVLASMGSQALQASAGSALDRSVRGAPLPPGPGRSSATYIPASASRPGHGYMAGSITSGLPSPSATSSPSSSGVHRRHSGGSGSPSPGHGASNTNNGGVVPGSRLSPLDKMAAMKAGGRETTRHGFELQEERGGSSRRSPPKVSFDSVVKEFGGESGGAGSESPPTPGYLRASLSGKEGSLKHRILTRPSDSEPPSGEDSPGVDRDRRPGQYQQGRDEPVAKRAKYPAPSSSPLSPTPPGVVHAYHGSREETMRGNSSRGSHHHHHPSITTNHSSAAAYHSTEGLSLQTGTTHLSSPPPPHTQYHHSHHPHQHYPQHQQQRYPSQPLQEDISGNNNTTTINKNTRDNNNTSSSNSNTNSGIQHQTHSGYQGGTSSTSAAAPSRRRRHSSNSNSPPAPPHLPSTSRSPPPPNPSSSSSSHLQYPQHFMKGSIIQLANGALKRVEDLQTEDFVSSAQVSSDLKVDSSTVVRIEEHLERGTAMLSFSVGEHRVQVTVEATLEHPFFVFGQGWSSCSVTRTLARYGLDCQKLNVGDVCISLTHKDVTLNAADISQQQQQQHNNNNGDNNKLGPWDSKTIVESCARTASAVSSTPAISSASHCAISTSSPPPPPSSQQPKPAASVISPLKIDTKPSTSSTSHDLPVLPPPSSSLPSTKRQQQQELPPPMSNFVPVKKESSAAGYPHHYHHHSRRRSTASTPSASSTPAWQRAEVELSSAECKEELDMGSSVEGDEDGESVSRKRRWSAPDPGLVKVEKERERERQSLADQAQRLEERADSDTRQGEEGEAGVTDGSSIGSVSSSPSVSLPSSTK